MTSGLYRWTLWRPHILYRWLFDYGSKVLFPRPLTASGNLTVQIDPAYLIHTFLFIFRMVENIFQNGRKQKWMVEKIKSIFFTQKWQKMPDFFFRRLRRPYKLPRTPFPLLHISVHGRLWRPLKSCFWHKWLNYLFCHLWQKTVFFKMAEFCQKMDEKKVWTRSLVCRMSPPDLRFRMRGWFCAPREIWRASLERGAVSGPLYGSLKS